MAAAESDRPSTIDGRESTARGLEVRATISAKFCEGLAELRRAGGDWQAKRSPTLAVWLIRPNLSMEGMMNPFIRAVAFPAVVALCITAGCKNQKQPGGTASSGRSLTLSPSVPSDAKFAAPATAPSEESPNLLAHKTQTYAREMERLLEKQRAREAATQPVQAKPDTEVVSPSAGASAAAPQVPPSPPAPPVESSAAPDNHSQALTANQRVSLTPSDAGSSAEQGAAVRTPTPSPAAPSQAGQSTDPTGAQKPIDALDRRFLQGVHDYPNEIAPQLNYQLLQFVRGDSVPVMRPMAGMRERDRDILNAVLDALTNFRNAVRADNNLLQAQKIKPFLNLADRLRAQADLTLPTLLLCRRVDGFGSYDPIEPAKFVAGKSHPAIIYCEIANFASTRDDKRMWTTKISEREVLYTESGLPVWPANPQSRTISDACRNRRHDFFIVKLIHLPATLTIGRYLLKVTIVDQQTNRMAEGTIPIDIVAE